MGSYVLTGKITVSCHTVVEADSLEEAIRKAGDRSVEMDNFGNSENESWIVEDLDGDPYDIRGDEE